MRAVAACVAFFALLIAGCGGEDSASTVAELAAYDDTKPLRVQIEGENQGSTDITYQSPRGGDVPASLVLPPGAKGGTKRYPVVIFVHPYLASQGPFYREAFALAERGWPLS